MDCSYATYYLIHKTNTTMKNLRIILLGLLAGVINFSQAEPGAKLLLRNGEQVCFSFAHHPVIKTSDTEIVLYVDGKEQIVCTLADVQRVEMLDDVETAINLENSSDKMSVVFSIGNGTMTIDGLKAKESIAVYSVNGAKTVSLKALRNGSLSVPLSSLPHGVCVVNTASGISYKLYNK